ncbi:MAG: hypothetical protein ACRDTE_15700 [Pseudonocardiaceae bacterium]
MSLVDLWGLIPVLAAAYEVVLGVVVLATGSRLFLDRKRRGHRRRGVPPVGVIGRGNEGAR